MTETLINSHDIGEMVTYVCCDCGLAHDTVLKRDVKNSDKFWLRHYRSNHSTGQYRRHNEFPCKEIPPQ